MSEWSDQQPNKRPIFTAIAADRVVANGDTANKIGTYQLAIVAKVPVHQPSATLEATQGKSSVNLPQMLPPGCSI